jgi:glutathione peroxidase
MLKNKWIKKVIITGLIVAVALFFLKQKNMTLKQSILKNFYAVIMWGSHLANKKNAVLENVNNAAPSQSLYALTVTDNSGKRFSLEQYKGKKIMLVNTASDCGFTAQYAGLEKLYQQHKEKLIILAFPANDFKQQEKGTDADIAQFCKINYGVSFPIMQKSIVIKNNAQNEAFKWLTNSNLNGWNNTPPKWNFTKFLVNENGILTHVFATSTSPLDKEVVTAVTK